MNRKRPYRKVVYRKKIMILLVQIVNRNLGDTVIADNAEYLVQQALPRIGGRHYVLQYYDIQSEDYELVRAADLIIFGGGGLIKYKQEKLYLQRRILATFSQPNYMLVNILLIIGNEIFILS